ncbi:glycosyltransferase family 2 protein [Candidatus Pacearchaeota archaeon]|nr:glycosyltransferase family 2 protein [Candidatus Pacearchaeota archaeon]
MKLTIILPTYNNEKTIEECLRSIFAQDFPKNQFEVLLLDGGSQDKTLEIVKKYPVKLVNNPKRNEENARIMGINLAKGEIIGFIDADNVITEKNWISEMLNVFKDKDIAFADTLYYTYRKKDKIRVRYQALIGGDDPLAAYLGIHSRWSYLNKSWTDCPHEDKDQGKYYKTKLLDLNRVPPMGSNGFLIRTKILRKFVKNSFIHSDIIYDLVNKGYNCFAKVKVGIVHNQPRFFPNKIRRIIRRLNKEVAIKYNYGVGNKDTLKTALYIAVILPVLFDTLKGFFRKPSLAWFFHPVACFGELFIHAYIPLKYKIVKLFRNN